MASVPQAIERLSVVKEPSWDERWVSVRVADIRTLLTQYDAAVEALRTIRIEIAADHLGVLEDIENIIDAILTNQGEKAGG